MGEQMIKVEKYDFLHPDAAAIRQDVFVREQGFINEFDDVDKDAVHIVIYDGKNAAAVCRVYRRKNDASYFVGRVAVARGQRGKGLGAELMKEAELSVIEAGGTDIYVSSQMRVSDFYGKLGYTAMGEPYDDEGCPHIMMRKTLNT